MWEGETCAQSDIRVALPGWISCDGLGLPLSISCMGPWGRCSRLEPCPGLGRQDVSAAQASFLLPCTATWRPVEAREREKTAGASNTVAKAGNAFIDFSSRRSTSEAGVPTGGLSGAPGPWDSCVPSGPTPPPGWSCGLQSWEKQMGET